VRSVWISKDNSHVKAGRVVSDSQEGGKNLENERIESTAETAKEESPMVNDSSCIRLRPECKDHAWSYDFVMARTYAGRAIMVLNIMDEHTREYLVHW